MNTVSHVPTENQIKQFAKAIRSALRELHDFEINHTQALEISSRAHGFKNWNVACAIAKKHSKSLMLPIKEIVTPHHPIHGEVIANAKILKVAGVEHSDTPATSTFPSIPSQEQLHTMSTIKRLHMMEDHFELIGHPELKIACKAIVGNSNNATEFRISVHEGAMKESEGVWRATWLPHKIAILENEDLFKKVANEFGYDAISFIDGLYDEITKIEGYLSSEE